MRKGMSSGALSLIIGISLLLLILLINAALDPTSGFRDFLKKVPWLNKIVSSDSSSGGTTPDGSVVSGCGAICTAEAKACPITQVCKNNACTNSAACTGQSIGVSNGNVISFVAPTTDGSQSPAVFGHYYGINTKISDGMLTDEKTGTVGRLTITRGDTLEYDVYLPLETPCAGGITLSTSDGKDLNSDDSWKDQNNIIGTLKNCDADPKKVAADSDMTSYAYRKWYHRVLPLTGDIVGQQLASVSLVMNGETYNAIYIALYDNIVIKRGGNNYIIFRDSLAISPDNSCKPKPWDTCRYDEGKTNAKLLTPKYLPPDKASPQNNIVGGATGDILKFKADADGSGYVYVKFSSLATPQTVKAGDIVEYDVYLDGCQKDLGGIDLMDDSGHNRWGNENYWKKSYDWKNGQVVSANPDNGGMDLSVLACQKWYHRILPAPPGLWNKPVQVLNLVMGRDVKLDTTFTVYYDNIQITDGTGVVAGFYPGGNEYPATTVDKIDSYSNPGVTKITPADINRPV